MALQQIAEGGNRSLLGVARFDDDFREGQAGELRITIRQVPFFPDLPPGFVTSLNFALNRAPGLELTGPVTFIDGILCIPFRRGPAPLVLIAAVLAIFFVGAILLLVTAWSLFREPVENILNAGANIADAIATNARPLIIGGLVLGAIVLVSNVADKQRRRT